MSVLKSIEYAQLGTNIKLNSEYNLVTTITKLDLYSRPQGVSLKSALLCFALFVLRSVAD